MSFIYFCSLVFTWCWSLKYTCWFCSNYYCDMYLVYIDMFHFFAFIWYVWDLYNNNIWFYLYNNPFFPACKNSGRRRYAPKYASRVHPPQMIWLLSVTMDGNYHLSYYTARVGSLQSQVWVGSDEPSLLCYCTTLASYWRGRDNDSLSERFSTALSSWRHASLLLSIWWMEVD